MPSALPAVCILAGGLGSRLGAVSNSKPKCLTNVAGRPFLEYQLELLSYHGATRVVLCVGHLGDQVEARIGRQLFGLTIEYSYDGVELIGTLGAIRRAAPLLGDRFLVMYGDTYLRIDYERFVEEWMRSGLSGGMSVLHNHGQWDGSNAVYRANRVIRYEKGAEDASMEWIDYGLGALRYESLGLIGEDERELAVLYQELAARGELFGFEASKRFFEIGTPASLADASDFLRRASRHVLSQGAVRYRGGAEDDRAH